MIKVLQINLGNLLAFPDYPCRNNSVTSVVPSCWRGEVLIPGTAIIGIVSNTDMGRDSTRILDNSYYSKLKCKFQLRLRDSVEGNFCIFLLLCGIIYVRISVSSYSIRNTFFLAIFLKKDTFSNNILL